VMVVVGFHPQAQVGDGVAKHIGGDVERVSRWRGSSAHLHRAADAVQVWRRPNRCRGMPRRGGSGVGRRCGRGQERQVVSYFIGLERRNCLDRAAQFCLVV
jgi:poly(3-hydroxybutyrate) depolymerase